MKSYLISYENIKKEISNKLVKKIIGILENENKLAVISLL
jgi:hypothetical protein